MSCKILWPWDDLEDEESPEPGDELLGNAERTPRIREDEPKNGADF